MKINNKLQHVMGEFPKGLDSAVNEHFGTEAKCNSQFSIVEMTYITLFEAKGAKRKQVSSFIAGFLAGNQELKDRIHTTP